MSWDNDGIQFPRLLAEIAATVDVLEAPKHEAYVRYVEHNLERIEQGGWVPVCYAEFASSEELQTYFIRTALPESMDLTEGEISALFDRAQKVWEDIKSGDSSFCLGNPTGEHHPYGVSGPVAGYEELVADITCMHCGASGSTTIKNENVLW